MLSQLTPVHSSSQVVLFLDQCVIYVRSASLTRGRLAKGWDGGWGEGMCVLSQALGWDLGVLSCFVFPNGLFRIPPSPVIPSSHA